MWVGREHAGAGVHRHRRARPGDRACRSIAGPKRPQDRVLLKDASSAFRADLTKGLGVPANDADKRVKVAGTNYEITHGDVVIAAITSCTNTQQPVRDARRRAAGAEGARAAG